MNMLKRKLKRNGIMYLAFVAICLLAVFLQGCGKSSDTENGKLSVVATTTMLADLTRVIGGDEITVEGLMGPGVDPHLYQASAGDVELMQNADVVIYNGLHLEGKMGEIFESLGTQGKNIICIADGMDESSLLEWDGGGSVYDPHIWFDVTNWKAAAKEVCEKLSVFDPSNKSAYESNLESYLVELDEADEYVRNRAQEIPEESRILVTAHDAFQYFARAYGFEVRGIQGISTDSEAGTADVSELADFIADNKIKAIFVETSVPTRTVEALQSAVYARDFTTEIGGSLYSDSLGDEESGADTYVKMVKANIDTIVEALK